MKVCVVTGARSEYGLLRWTMEEVRENSVLKLQVIVTGGHLSHEQGDTWREIKRDGFFIDATIPIVIDSDSKGNIARSMGLCSLGMGEALERLGPDLLVVLGDRWELLPICGAALVTGVPIAHISGGDVTLGAFDDQIRNAVSQMATVHFPGTEESAKRLRTMGIDPQNIFVVGEPGIETLKRIRAMQRSELAAHLDLDAAKKWILLTWHPETKRDIAYNIRTLENILRSLGAQEGIQVVATYANTDPGGAAINERIEKWASQNRSWVRVVKNLGQSLYASLVREVCLVMGNSSSGIVEAPTIPVRSLNIGNRQLGRHVCHTVRTCSPDISEIQEGLAALLKACPENIQPDFWYGDGNTAIRIVEHIVEWGRNHGAL